MTDLKNIDKELFNNLTYKKDYEWILKKDGTPNMSYSKNRKNLINIVKRLNFSHDIQNNDQLEEHVCPCCMEPINYGSVTLNCKHKYCVDCFTKHSKIDNKCALCRVEFSEKPKQQEHMLDETRDCIITTYLTDDYATKCLDTITNIDILYKDESEAYRSRQKLLQLKLILRTVTLYFMNLVINWYKSS